MYTKASLHADLAAMGAPKDSVVLVHTSLKAVGDGDGRGEGFLEALIDYFTAEGGLLLIPTHTWRNLSDKTKLTLDMTSTDTCIGRLPSLAAGHPYAHRSAHPTHSMAVFDGLTRTGEAGPAEEYIAAENAMTDSLTSTHPDGCYGKLRKLGGKVLLVGVTHNRNTYLHAVEEMIGVPNRLSIDPVPTTVKLPSGEIITRPLHCHNSPGIPDVSANYPKYEPAFRKYGAIRDGRLGDAPTQLCDARIMADVLKLVRDRSDGIELMADDHPLDEWFY